MDISFVARKFQRSIAGLGIATVLASSLLTGTAFAMTFDDVDSDYFAHGQIDALSDDGIMTGDGATGLFLPEDNLTREQAAKILVEAFLGGVDESAEVTCEGDVSSWAEGYMATANVSGIIEGEGDGSCNSSGDMNRASFAAAVVSASGVTGSGFLASEMFTDVTENAWFDDDMGILYENGVMGGYAGTTLMGPGDPVTRGQAAKMVYNAMNPDYNPVDGEPAEPGETTTGGALEIILSSDSPEDYTYFSAGTNAEVASFEVTASEEDVLITSFEVELASGDADSITSLALYNDEGTRISKVDTSVDSDDIARMGMLNSGYTVEAGTSENFRLMNSFMAIDGTAPDANTSTLYSYSFDSSMIESNASSVEVENNLTTGIFGLLDNDTGAITIDDVDAPGDVQVGETDAELLAFEISETSNDKDVWLMGLTFENTGTAELEEALDDIALYFDGDMVAEGTQNGDYISFQMDSESAPLIEAGKTESLEVRARIMSESSETLILGIEETLDVRGVDEDDNDVAVTSTFAVATTTIEAGAISVVAYDAETDKIRADREDVELGRFELTPGTDGMELISLNIDITLPTEEDDSSEVWYPSDLLENFKVELNGSSYSLDLGTAGASEVYSADIDKTLNEGTVYEFVVYADTVTTTAAAATATASDRDGVTYDVDSYTAFSVEMSLDDLGTGATTDGIVIEESASGDQVTDFTPSAVTFNSLQGETAGVEINGLSLSSAKNVVVGAEELILEFQVEEAADVSDLVIKDLNINILVDEDGATYSEADEDADNSNISSVDLYQVASDDTETLVDSISGSNLGSTTSEGTVVNFDFGDITVAQNSEENFRVYVTFVDDETLNADTFQAVVSSYDVRDDENNNVYDSGDTTPFGDFTDDTEPTSGRTITLVSTGALYVEVDNDDTTYGTQSKRFIQNGATEAGIMTLALRSTNENVTIEDYTLTLSAGSIKEMFTKFYIYDEDGVLVGTKTVTTETTSISFTDVGTELTAYADVTTRYYVLADATTYGLNEIGTADALTVASRTWTMAATTVKGNDSNNTLAINDNTGGTLESGEIGYGSTTASARAGDDGATATDSSEGFGMAATLISEVELVDNYNDSIFVASSLNNGSNNVAIIAVTVDDTLNAESTGDDVKVDLDSLVTQYVALTGTESTTVNATSIERIGGTEGAIAGVNAGDAVASKATFTLTWTTDNLIVPGTTAYFLVKADVTKDVTAENDDYIQFALRDLNSSNTGAAYADNFAWKDFSSATANVAVYMGSTSSIEGAVISE